MRQCRPVQTAAPVVTVPGAQRRARPTNRQPGDTGALAAGHAAAPLSPGGTAVRPPAAPAPHADAGAAAPGTGAGAGRRAVWRRRTRPCWAGTAIRRVAYLTFDDGPGPATGRILDILAAAGVKATFCMLGTSR